LIEVGNVGVAFTWSNKHDGSSPIRMRLDKAYDTPEWMKLYVDCSPSPTSDLQRSVPYPSAYNSHSLQTTFV